MMPPARAWLGTLTARANASAKSATNLIFFERIEPPIPV